MLTIDILKDEFTVCGLKNAKEAPEDMTFCFLSVTDEEISLVCPTERVPKVALKREDGWKGFRICGQLDFSLVGILAGISGILAQNNISIFAVSTFNTDYIFVKKNCFERALALLCAHGCRVNNTETDTND